MKVGQLIKLTWLSQKGEQVLKEHGNEWEVLSEFENVPMIRMVSKKTGHARNMNWPIDDHDFMVWRFL